MKRSHWLLATLLSTASCFDRGDRYLDTGSPIKPLCTVGARLCSADLLECKEESGGLAWVTVDACSEKNEVCAPGLLECTKCLPSTFSCNGQDVLSCSADGSTNTTLKTCDTSKAEACRDGACHNLCGDAIASKSNIGCEYWGVDLDNAMISATQNAAAQQYALVVSNPQPDVPVTVHVLQDDSDPGTAGAPYEIQSETIAALNLQVFKLGPREVDGSPPGQFNTGTNTALTRHAYKVTADFPIVVYQFNPLDNVNVFSNDASLLYPTESYTYDGGTLELGYVVLGWPQTIAATDNPDTNFNPNDPINLRATLTIVGTRPGTHVHVRPTTTVVAGGPVEKTGPGGEIDAVLDPYDVLNLETGDFNADFTGTLIEADNPVAVFSGSEASDAPHFEKLSERRCCADHLEAQLAPTRASGTTFAVPHTPSRTDAINRAGATIEKVPEPDFVRFIATTTEGAEITTTLPAPDDHFTLSGLGDFHEVTAMTDFTADSSDPIVVGQIMASQEACGIKTGLPGGDPSLMMVPPLEQARSQYVFLTPDKYVFDFINIVAPADAKVELDGQPVGAKICDILPADGLTKAERKGKDPSLLVYRCQLSFPVIDPSTSPATVSPGLQNDGVHSVVASAPVFVDVVGWDSYVSYAYAAGTDLKEIAPPQ